MHRAYGLRPFERLDNKPVDWDEVQRIKDKYDPMEADRRCGGGGVGVVCGCATSLGPAQLRRLAHARL